MNTTTLRQMEPIAQAWRRAYAVTAGATFWNSTSAHELIMTFGGTTSDEVRADKIYSDAQRRALAMPSIVVCDGVMCFDAKNEEQFEAYAAGTIAGLATPRVSDALHSVDERILPVLRCLRQRHEDMNAYAGALTRLTMWSTLLAHGSYSICDEVNHLMPLGGLPVENNFGWSKMIEYSSAPWGIAWLSYNQRGLLRTILAKSREASAHGVLLLVLAALPPDWVKTSWVSAADWRHVKRTVGEMQYGVTSASWKMLVAGVAEAAFPTSSREWRLYEAMRAHALAQEMSGVTPSSPR